MADRLSFEIEWLGANDSVRSPDLRATWARLAISVGGEVVTLVEDQSNKSVRRAIYLSLYPLAEWIATNWWLLRFDSHGTRRLDPERRHTTLGANDGFLWPDLRIVPEGEFSELSWWADRQIRRGAECRFLSQGSALVHTQQLVEELARFVDAVLERLEDAGISDTPLHKEWNETSNLDDDEAEFAEAAARLGLDPFSGGIDFSKLIESAFTSLDPAVRHDFFDAVRPDSAPDALAWVERSMAKVPKGPSSLELTKIRSAVSLPGDSQSWLPWEAGWAMARQVRELLGVGGTEPLQDLAIGLEEDPIEGRREIVGLGRGTDDHLGIIASRHLSSASSRFHRARAICHAAAGSEGMPFLLTNSSATGQRVGRAFAAEFLVPAAGLRELLDDDHSADAISDAADYFDAPVDVVWHQVENQLVD